MGTSLTPGFYTRTVSAQAAIVEPEDAGLSDRSRGKRPTRTPGATDPWTRGRNAQRRQRPGAERRRRSSGGGCRKQKVFRRNPRARRGAAEIARVWIGGRWGRRRRAGSSGGRRRERRGRGRQ